MPDPRLQKLADVLVQYSTHVKPGQLVLIKGSTTSLELIRAVHESVVRQGAHAHLHLDDEWCHETLLTYGSSEQLAFRDPIWEDAITKIDAYIGFWGEPNTRALSQIDPARQAQRSVARRTYMDTFLRRAAAGDLKWVSTQTPCHASAQDAEMSLRQYADFVFGAGMLHHVDPVAAWQQLSQRQQRVVDYLNGRHEVRFVTPQGTDLTVDVTGRQWINCDGHENFPDGEVFTGPIETATRGTVQFSFPAVHMGHEVHGIRFEFRDGRVCDASATKGEEFLISMLDQDPGARVLGEIALGTNYAIERYTKNTLFDEKIGGTFHAAVGCSYPETGGTNQSGLHWDMVCDLRHGGEVWVDGVLISRDGRFLRENWPAPPLPTTA